MPKQIGFTRWYDRSPQVSQAVRTLEKADPDFQRSIAEIINELTDLKNLSAKSEGGLKKIGSQKIMGLMKSKAKRRWYDENPQVHKAINAMYVMEDEERDEVALKIIVSLVALREYKLRCLKENALPAYREMLAIVKSVFQRDPQKLKGLTVVRSGAEEQMPEPVSAESLISDNSNDVIESADGLKISFKSAANNTLL